MFLLGLDLFGYGFSIGSHVLDCEVEVFLGHVVLSQLTHLNPRRYLHQSISLTHCFCPWNNCISPLFIILPILLPLYIFFNYHLSYLILPILLLFSLLPFSNAISQHVDVITCVLLSLFIHGGFGLAEGLSMSRDAWLVVWEWGLAPFCTGLWGLFMDE